MTTRPRAFTVRLPGSVYDLLKTESKHLQRSMTQVVVDALAEYLSTKCETCNTPVRPASETAR